MSLSTRQTLDVMLQIKGREQWSKMHLLLLLRDMMLPTTLNLKPSITTNFQSYSVQLFDSTYQGYSLFTTMCWMIHGSIIRTPYSPYSVDTYPRISPYILTGVRTRLDMFALILLTIDKSLQGYKYPAISQDSRVRHLVNQYQTVLVAAHQFAI